jgi:hypothetical protein
MFYDFPYDFNISVVVVVVVVDQMENDNNSKNKVLAQLIGKYCVSSHPSDGGHTTIQTT